MKEILLNKNIPISSSVVLNNFSIQNIILSPSKIVNHVKSPLISSNFNHKKNNNYYSKLFSISSPKTSLRKSSVIQNNIQNNIIPNNYTSLISYKSASKLNYCKSKNSQVISEIFSQNIASSENNNFSTNYSRTDEKHPRDSLKKLNLKNTKDQIVIETNNRILKNSISQRVFRTIKKPISLLSNNNITQNTKKKEKENIQPSNIIKNYLKKKGLSSSNFKLENQLIPTSKLNLEEFQMAEQIGKGTFGKIYCVKWNKNNKLYALKKETLIDKESIQKRREIFKIIQNF